MQYVVSAGCALCALQPARRRILRELSTPVEAMSVSSFSQGWCTGSPVIVPGIENMFPGISKPEGGWSERLPGGSNRFAPRKADQLVQMVSLILAEGLGDDVGISGPHR